MISAVNDTGVQSYGRVVTRDGVVLAKVFWTPGDDDVTVKQADVALRPNEERQLKQALNYCTVVRKRLADV